LLIIYAFRTLSSIFFLKQEIIGNIDDNGYLKAEKVLVGNADKTDNVAKKKLAV